MEQFVRDEVRRGAFASSSEYVRTLVRERYLKQREDGEKLKALDEEDTGLTQPSTKKQPKRNAA